MYVCNESTPRLYMHVVPIRHQCNKHSLVPPSNHILASKATISTQIIMLYNYESPMHNHTSIQQHILIHLQSIHTTHKAYSFLFTNSLINIKWC